MKRPRTIDLMRCPFPQCPVSGRTETATGGVRTQGIRPSLERQSPEKALLLRATYDRDEEGRERHAVGTRARHFSQIRSPKKKSWP